MPKYSFLISDGDTFSDTEDLPDDETAWRQAVHTVRDIESTLSSRGGNWSIVVDREDKPIFRIDVWAQKLS
jgi:hypothetical protein